MRRALILLLVPPLLLAGCATPRGDPLGSAEAARAGHACPGGQFVHAFDGEGVPLCAFPYPASFACPAGTHATGVDDAGGLVCEAPPETTPPTPAVPSPPPPGLRLLNVYGVRPGSEGDLRELRVYLELVAGSAPVDLSGLAARVSDGGWTFDYVFGAAQDAAASPPRFGVACIRGGCSASDPVMRAGDLAEVRLPLPEGVGIPPRTSVALTLVPEPGPAVEADFKTPNTYAGDRVITLR